MMNISIKGLRIPLTEAIKEYVSKKLEPLEKIMTHNAYVHVELGKPSAHHKTGPDAFMAEITIDTNGHVYFARARESDLYAAIDAVTAEIIETVKQGKGKRHTLLRRGRMMLKQFIQKDF